MRIRTIKPEFFLDPKILDLTDAAKLLFIGLWCAADRAGRLRFEPRTLRLMILPEHPPKVVSAAFAELEAAALTTRYGSDGVEYLAVPNFLKHQRPNNKEGPTAVPDPPLSKSRRLELDPVEREGNREREEEGEQEGEWEGKGNGTPIPPTGETSLTRVQIPRRSRVAASYSTGFLEAWGAYPHYEQRSSKAEAWGVWQKRGLEAGTMNVLAWIEAGKLGEDWTREGRRFVPGLQVWLRKVDFAESPPGLAKAPFVEYEWQEGDIIPLAELRALASAREGR